jgi:hypothetical protein
MRLDAQAAGDVARPRDPSRLLLLLRARLCSRHGDERLHLDEARLPHAANIHQVLELLKTVVLLTGFDTRRRCPQMDWFVCWNGKTFDAARSNEAADENAVATFAYRIMLNVRGLQGNQDDK